MDQGIARKSTVFIHNEGPEHPFNQVVAGTERELCNVLEKYIYHYFQRYPNMYFSVSSLTEDEKRRIGDYLDGYYDEMEIAALLDPDFDFRTMLTRNA